MINLHNEIQGVPESWDECVDFLQDKSMYGICNNMVHLIKQRKWTINDSDKFTSKELAESYLFYIKALTIAWCYNAGHIKQTLDKVYVLKNDNGTIKVVPMVEPLGIALQFCTEQLANAFLENMTKNEPLMISKITNLL